MGGGWHEDSPIEALCCGSTRCAAEQDNYGLRSWAASCDMPVANSAGGHVLTVHNLRRSGRVCGLRRRVAVDPVPTGQLWATFDQLVAEGMQSRVWVVEDAHGVLQRSAARHAARVRGACGHLILGTLRYPAALTSS